MEKKKGKNNKSNTFFDILPIILFFISVINMFLCAFMGIISLIIPILIAIWTIINIKKKDILYCISLLLSIISIVIFICGNYFGILDINNQLGVSREEQFVRDTKEAVNLVRDDYIYNKYKKTKCYSLKDVNKLAKKDNKLNFSPDGVKYSETSFIKVYLDPNGVVNSSVCLVDDNNNGFNYIDQYNINKKYLNVGDADLCILPSDCQ